MMVLRCVLVLGILCSLLVAVPLYAANLSFGTEMTGMGGAGVALTKDVYAAVWNPAGLARVNRFSIEPNLSFYTDQPAVLRDLVDYHFSGAELPTEPLHFEAGGMAGFATPRFAINMGGQALGFQTPSAEAASYHAEGVLVYNSKISMALPLPILGRTLAVGTTFNYYAAQKYEAWLDRDFACLDYRFNPAGTGRSLDVGAQIDLAGNLRVGCVARNIRGNFKWDQDDLVSFVQPVTPTYQAGIGWDGRNLRAAFDWEWNEDDLRRYRIGLAKDFWRVFTVRVGGIIEPEAEPTYTGGFSLRLGALSLNLAAANQADAWRATVSMALNM